MVRGARRGPLQGMPMTVNVARRRSKARNAAGSAEPPNGASGEIGETVFNCPACGRPLAIGVRRCPGCSTRLILGVRAARASMFVTVGLIFGVAFGGGLGAVLSAIRQPAHDAQVAALAAAAALVRAQELQAAAAAEAAAAEAAASQSAAPTSGSAGTGTAVTVPAISASALSQALVVNSRLAGSTTAFESSLAAPKFDVLEVSQLLRDASSDSVIGLQLAQNLNNWSRGAAVGGQLTTFYSSVQSTAAEGLGASVRNEAAYRRAATAMVRLLGGLDPIDGEARTLAAGAGISLPAETSPVP